MKLVAVILIVAMFFASVIILPGTQVQALEMEYKELNSVHVVNTTDGKYLACWGNNMAWSTYNNVTTGTVSGGAGSIINTHYYSTYNDLAMSDSAIVWTNVDHYKVPYTATDIAYASPGGSAETLLGANTEKDDVTVRLDGNQVIYNGYTGTGTELRYSTIGSSSYTVLPGGYYSYDISGDNVAQFGSNHYMQVYDTSGTLLQDWGQFTGSDNIRISGDYLVYYTLDNFGKSSHIMLKNWKTNDTQIILYNMDGVPGSLDIEDNFVVFSGLKNPVNSIGGAVVFLYDIQAQKTFQISPEYPQIFDVAIGGGKVAWSAGPEYQTTDSSKDYYNLYAADLPAPGVAPVVDPIIIDPDEEHFDLGDIITRDITLGLTGSTQSINNGEGVIFTSNSEEHALVITSITSSGAKIDVYSDPISITMVTGETKEVDTNGNGVNDLSVTLNSVDSIDQTAEVSISSLSDGGSLIPFPGFGMIAFLIIAMGVIAASVRRNGLGK